MTRHVHKGKMQQNGQLMGSIISFPFLCIINATVSRMALELSLGRKLEFYQLESLLKINGDDCVLADTSDDQNLYPVWESVVRYVGLEPSVGKSFYSREFILINSRMYRRGGDDSFYEIPFVNLALVHAKAKDGSNSKEVWEFKGLTDKLRSISSGFDQDRLFSWFIQRNLNKLSEFNVYWFLPEWCGGLGITPPVGYWKTSHGLIARKVAHFIRRLLAQNAGRERSIVKRIPLDPSSLVWNEAQKLRGEKIRYLELEGNPLSDYEPSLSSLFCQIAALSPKNLLGSAFDRVELSDGVLTGKYDKNLDLRHKFLQECRKVLSHNARLHEKATVLIYHAPPHEVWKAIDIADLGPDRIPQYRNDILNIQVFSDLEFPEKRIDTKTEMSSWHISWVENLSYLEELQLVS